MENIVFCPLLNWAFQHLEKDLYHKIGYYWFFICEIQGQLSKFTNWTKLKIIILYSYLLEGREGAIYYQCLDIRVSYRVMKTCGSPHASPPKRDLTNSYFSEVFDDCLNIVTFFFAQGHKFPFTIAAPAEVKR